MKIERRYFDLYQTEWNEINEKCAGRKKLLQRQTGKLKKKK